MPARSSGVRRIGIRASACAIQSSGTSSLPHCFRGRPGASWRSCELPRSSRKHRPTSLLIFDLDHFKRFNDTYGHECGDRVLHEVGALLRSSVRQSDIACRIGGEEFVLLLPETELSDALATAEKLRVRVEAL
ncbi:MAG: GGDEF domain-containing protein, partial [Steroidobacteraceae bacterium]